MKGKDIVTYCNSDKITGNQGIVCNRIQDICHNYVRLHEGLDGSKTPTEEEQIFTSKALTNG